MNVISRPAVNEAIRRHPDAEAWLNAWWKCAKTEQWKNLHDVRARFPAADQVAGCLVFNACGNKYRLIVGMIYADESTGGTLFVKHFLTHSEYSKNRWQKDCW